MTAVNGQNNGALENAEEIIERFGGIRPMATKMDIPVTTVQGWKKRNVIPENRREDILQAARRHGVDLSGIVRGAGASAPSSSPASSSTSYAASSAASSVPSSAAPSSSFEAEIARAARREDSTTRARHEEAVASAVVSGAQPVERPVSEPVKPQTADGGKKTKTADAIPADLAGRLKVAERRAVQKSTFVTILLVSLVGGMGVLLLWPYKDHVDQHGRRLGTLEQKVTTVEAEQNRFKGLIPANLDQKFADMEEKARALQIQVGDIANRAQSLTTSFTGMDGMTLGDRLGHLETQVTELAGSTDLAAVVEKLRQLQQTISNDGQLSQTVSELRAVVSNVEGQDQAALDNALAQAQQEPGALGQTLQGVSQTELKAAAMLLGLAQFRSSLNRSAPFAEDLQLLQNMLGENADPALMAAITKLAPQAERGVLTPAGLSDELKALTGDIVVSSLKGEDVTMKDKAMARLNNVLQVKKDGELITGTETQATIARAQSYLDAGDVQSALTELQGLQGPAAQTAAPVIDQAQVTLMAQQLQDMLTSRVVSSLGGGALPGVGSAVTGGNNPYTTGSGNALKGLLYELESIGARAIPGHDASGSASGSASGNVLGGGGIIYDEQSGSPLTP